MPYRQEKHIETFVYHQDIQTSSGERIKLYRTSSVVVGGFDSDFESGARQDQYPSESAYSQGTYSRQSHGAQYVEPGRGRYGEPNRPARPTPRYDDISGSDNSDGGFPLRPLGRKKPSTRRRDSFDSGTNGGRTEDFRTAPSYPQREHSGPRHTGPLDKNTQPGKHPRVGVLDHVPNYAPDYCYQYQQDAFADSYPVGSGVSDYPHQTRGHSTDVPSNTRAQPTRRSPACNSGYRNQDPVKRRTYSALDSEDRRPSGHSAYDATARPHTEATDELEVEDITEQPNGSGKAQNVNEKENSPPSYEEKMWGFIGKHWPEYLDYEPKITKVANMLFPEKRLHLDFAPDSIFPNLFVAGLWEDRNKKEIYNAYARSAVSGNPGLAMESLYHVLTKPE